jgi:hypothetical protein
MQGFFRGKSALCGMGATVIKPLQTDMVAAALAPFEVVR